MSQKNKRLRGLLAALDRIQRSTPTVVCQGKCQRACGPIAEAVLPLELERVRKFLNDPTFEFRGLDEVAESMATGYSCVTTCPLLSPEGMCSVHSVRPLICRLWGVVDDPLMRCPYGCAGNLVSNAEARDLWDAITQLDKEYGANNGQAMG